MFARTRKHASVRAKARRCEGSNARTHERAKSHACAPAASFLSARSADRLGVALRAEQLRPAQAEVHPHRGARRSARSCQCLYHNTSVWGQALIAHMRSLGLSRSNLISAHVPPTPLHSWGNRFFSVGAPVQAGPPSPRLRSTFNVRPPGRSGQSLRGQARACKRPCSVPAGSERPRFRANRGRGWGPGAGVSAPCLCDLTRTRSLRF